MINQIYDKKQKHKISLYDDKVVLETDKQGFINATYKEIFLDKISSIEIERGTIFDFGKNAGAMFFLISGTKSRYETCFVFTWKKHYDEVIQLKNQIEELISLKEKTNKIEKTNSIADELLKLKMLLDEGVLSIDEFEKAKLKLLD